MKGKEVLLVDFEVPRVSNGNIRLSKEQAMELIRDLSRWDDKPKIKTVVIKKKAS